jgi:chemotaxis protein methyltransferase CheR
MMPLSPTTFDQLSRHIQRLCGLVLSSDKTYLVHHRLGPLAVRQGWQSYEELCDRLRAPGWSSLHEQVIEAITTHETSFFRDGHPWEALRKILLPEVLEAACQRKLAANLRPHARIWCAGVATGQEAYSLAILLQERLQHPACAVLAPGDCGILATDLSAQLLEEARAGLYGDREIHRAVNAAYRARYFHKRDPNWQVAESIQRMVEFRRDNLLDGQRDLGPCDLILCRNVLIYFDDPTRRLVSQRFHDLLRPGGVLLLGSAENLYGISDALVAEQHGPTIFYRKRR